MTASIAPLPTPPNRSMDSATFIAAADAFLAALPAFVTQTNALAVQIEEQWSGTSTDSLTIGTGSKTFNIQPNAVFLPGQWVIAAETSAPTVNYMYGQVTSYDNTSGALIVNVTVAQGAGTHADWTVSLSGAQGSGANASQLNGKADTAFGQLAVAATWTASQTFSQPIIFANGSKLSDTGAGTFQFSNGSTGTATLNVSSSGSLSTSGTVTVGGNLFVSTLIGVTGKAGFTSPVDSQINFQNNAGTNVIKLGIGGGNAWLFGGLDAAAPAAQSLMPQKVAAGTSNTAGVNLSLAGGIGTGTGIGGSLVFQVAPAGSTGTTQNALATALTIDASKNATFTGTVTITPGAQATLNVNGASGTSAILNLAGNANTAASAFEIYQDNNNIGGLWQRANQPIVVGVNGSEAARFSTTGLSVGTSLAGGWSSDGIIASQRAAGTSGWAVSAYYAGTVSSSGSLLVRVDSTAAQLTGFYYTTGLVGNISTNGSSVAFNTTSDEQLKIFQGSYAFSSAKNIIKSDPVRRFVWNEHSPAEGDSAVGWGAQTSYGVSHDLATPGQGVPGDEDYRPWGVDQGKRTPYLWAVIGADGGILDQLEAMAQQIADLQAEVAALKGTA